MPGVQATSGLCAACLHKVLDTDCCTVRVWYMTTPPRSDAGIEYACMLNFTDSTVENQNVRLFWKKVILCS